MKRKLLVAAVIVVCLSLLAYGTTAYYTASTVAHNVITTGNVDIQLLEWADADRTTPFPGDGVSGIMPGSEVVKIVEVENTGGSAAYVRVKVDKTITLPEGTAGEVDPELIGIAFDSSAWTLKDGFYYYYEALEPGAVSVPLFTAVSLDPAMDNLYQKSSIEIAVTAYATQAANNGSSALDANGWPAA